MKKTSKKIIRVAFFGDGEAKKTDKHYKDAYEVAKLLAEKGYIIVDGGGPGVMKAATLGAKAGDGRVEVVILDPKKEPDNYEGTNKSSLNLADKIYKMPSYDKRLRGLVKLADAFVIFRGGTGTLTEIGLTWQMAKFNYGHHEPLIFFGKEWKKIIGTMIKELDLDKKEREVVAMTEKVERVAEILEEEVITVKYN